MANRKGEVSILAAVEQLEANTVKARSQGLDSLRQILGPDRVYYRIDELSDDAFHNILEAIFQIVRSEKPKLIRATGKASQSAASSRLASAASALKLVVEAVGNRLKQKTASAVLDHIIDTLPDADGSFCTPLQTEYLKSFSILLSNGSRGEHLRHKQWLTYVDFVLENITNSLDDEIDAEDTSFSQGQETGARNGVSLSLRLSQISSGRARQAPSDRQEELLLEELLLALKHLTSITNAPLILKFNQIIRLVVNWLEKMSRAEETAFEVLNYSLPTALSENVVFAATVLDNVIRTIRKRGLWSRKSTLLREHMLASMVLCQSLFSKTLWDAALLPMSCLEQMLQITRSEYEKQPDRERLQMEDLGFSAPHSPSMFSLSGINLAAETSRVINIWSTLSIMARLLTGIGQRYQIITESDNPETNPKRRKIENPIDQLIQQATDNSSRSRLVELQLCIFLVDQEGSISQTSANQLSQINFADLEDDPSTASWTCLLLARIASTDHLQHRFNPDFWKKLWLWASRAAAISTTTRPACFLLYSLIRSTTVRTALSSQVVLDSIFPDGISGPNALTDAALLMLDEVLRSGLLDTERSFKNFASHTVRWLEYQWTISTVPDRQHNAQMALFARIDLLHSVLAAAIGAKASTHTPSTATAASSIYVASVISREDLSFTKFMLSGVPQPQPRQATSTVVQTVYVPSVTVLAHLKHAVLELITSKAKSFYAACKTSVEERSSLINTDVIEVASTICMLCCSISPNLSEQDWHILKVILKPLWSLICGFLAGLPHDEFPRAFSKVAAKVTRIQLYATALQSNLATKRFEFSSNLNEVLEKHSESQGQTAAFEQDFMDSLDTRTSQSSMQRSTQSIFDVERSDTTVANGILASFPQQCFLLRLDLAHAKAALEPDVSAGTLAIEYTLALDPTEMLACRHQILSLLSSEITLSRNDISSLLTWLAEVCLQDRELARCEAALCLCLRITARFVPLWAIDQEDDLTNVGYDIYKWFIDIALGKGIASPRVLLAIAAMLDAILQTNPTFGTDSLPSARTSLLHVLCNSQTSLQYHLTIFLSNIFDGYVLSEHPAVFDDIIENLPSDPDRHEGIILRLYIIARLGAQWHTILRQSVYYIFETAANVPKTIPTATHCVQMICQKLQLDSPQQLLKLFSPQVFYTWLERQTLRSVPFSAFGYETLHALELDVEDELIPQIAMRNTPEHITGLVQSLGTSWVSLLEQCFAKSIAYAILTDIAVHRSTREIGKTEMGLLQHLGEDVYAKLCRANCAQTVSTVLLRLGDDRGFDKTSSQEEPGDDKFTIAYRLICARSSSQMHLPPGQQPSFRAKHLTSILDRVCMRAQETLDSIWTPALLLHVYRALLSDAKSAFGPLHTCAVLRKIRAVICLAGSTALSGYPLQMILHALRPFLTQFHSSEDAFGIFWYLLDRGKDYLKQKLPFVTGLSVAIFASVSKFASSSQESTTQESHFTSTMTKAQEFRLWLGQYLQSFDATSLSDQASSTFSDIVKAAKQITKAGSSAKTTSEGMLIYHLLADQASTQPLLSKTFFRLTLSSLCDNFAAATDFQDDILHEDEDVLRITPVLLSLLHYEHWQDPFRTWILQALGRAYTLQGPLVIEMNDSKDSAATVVQKSEVVVEDSYQAIVNILGELLWDDNYASASAAEATLQSIFTALPIENKAIVLGPTIDYAMFNELRFADLPCPALSLNSTGDLTVLDPGKNAEISNKWASEIVTMLCCQQKTDPVLSFLPALINLIPSIAPRLFPHVVHLALYFEVDQDQKIKALLTDVFNKIFDAEHGYSSNHIQYALDSIFYLRRCALPHESTMAKRNNWLAIDFSAAAVAALRCSMFRMALLMLEIHVSQYALTSSRASRRSSNTDLAMVPDILNQIYQNVDDPDFFYGTHVESDVASIVEKLCHEGHGYKALSFQSALFDSNIKTGGMKFASAQSGGMTVSALNLANLNGLSSSLGSFVATEHQDMVSEYNLQSLMNLHQWDIAQDRAISDHGSAMVSAMKTLSSAFDRKNIVAAIDQSSLKVAHLLLKDIHQRAQQIKAWTSLAALAELKETLTVNGIDEMEALLDKRSIRRPWTEQESFECIEPILLGREASFATITNNSQVRSLMGVSAPQAILLEVKALRASLKLGHIHEMSQFSLNRAAYLSELLPSATKLGVKVEAAIQYDLANTFWAQQETAAAIRILQNLHEQDLPDQAIEVQQAEILTDLGSKITEARLDRPDEVTARYLIPAIEALGKETMGSKVGRVFHNFAAFCDSQLREPDNVDEYERVEKIRDRKLQEVLELETMYKKGDSKTRDTIKAHYNKAKTWFKLDDQELQRLKAHRERLVRNCLENYLLSLRACQDYPNDVLRFLALWMEQSTSEPANTSVSKYLSTVPTYKFAPLMNQLSSRVLNEESPFQQLLLDLMYHICEDHPFHSLYQVFATSKSKGAQKDEVANSRHAAATKLSDKVMRKSSASNLWISIHNSNIQFVRVAQEKIPDKEFKTGSKLLLRRLPQGAKLEQTIQDMHHKIPPPTMKLEIRPGKDYASVPTIAKFEPQISIAGGVSAPKILTAIATDGSKHKMLLKGGNDDLRQDSIMEQVFEQVSNLLKDHRPTRQRKLGIRTYKVIPLTHNAGIIEFVRDTTPLHDYVLPAHTKYYPKDFKPNKCRKEISEAQSKSLNQRLQAYRNVVANFHPVMRFFFMEHFLDPDDWFQKRLNYSRSTAAISMLGHVLGLGDRHGHNILLDTKTGEVVHIDLGVAFEAGRVLPVPEVVPFRLTRDLVDGMGLSGVEGVFRRCCNFTLEALRRNQEAIMTILDVLRWDPLYSWSVSPLRLARMQENQEQAANAETGTSASDIGASVAVGAVAASKRNVNEPSEADRALAVVSKKLGKSLSVEATVNELIRQAMDERNLAVLYCGWAAYA